jgi:hypothetical protein
MGDCGVAGVVYVVVVWDRRLVEGVQGKLRETGRGGELAGGELVGGDLAIGDLTVEDLTVDDLAGGELDGGELVP